MIGMKTARAGQAARHSSEKPGRRGGQGRLSEANRQINVEYIGMMCNHDDQVFKTLQSHHVPGCH